MPRMTMECFFPPHIFKYGLSMIKETNSQVHICGTSATKCNIKTQIK